jgi:hypothetical protein
VHGCYVGIIYGSCNLLRLYCLYWHDDRNEFLENISKSVDSIAVLLLNQDNDGWTDTQSPLIRVRRTVYDVRVNAVQ